MCARHCDRTVTNKMDFSPCLHRAYSLGEDVKFRNTYCKVCDV